MWAVMRCEGFFLNPAGWLEQNRPLRGYPKRNLLVSCERCPNSGGESKKCDRPGSGISQGISPVCPKLFPQGCCDFSTAYFLKIIENFSIDFFFCWQRFDLPPILSNKWG
jgi:hypothetical protein